MLKKAVYSGQLSTAKSGSIMAFEDQIMTKTMTDKEAYPHLTPSLEEFRYTLELFLVLRRSIKRV